jgi:dihydrofolate synthase/folylpolyglutamate synthase
MRALVGELELDPKKFRAVHVTGSKGKGSTSALIAAGLTRAGLRTGRYSSPHVERIQERVTIDGVEVGDAPLAEALERAFEARERVRGLEPTWFDVVTAAALWLFRRERVDWLVAEVGLGGRLDSTNVLDGEVCVITNVELEHTAVLGGTRAAIAAEKAGILKSGCSLVTGLAAADEAGAVVEARARELGVRVLRPTWVGRGEQPSIEATNRSFAELALDELGRRGHRSADGAALSAALLDDEAVARARLPGRAERFRCGSTTVVLDGAHTPGSVAAVLRDLAEDPSLLGRPIAVVGLARDKDGPAILKTLAPAVESVVCTSVGSELHRTPEQIAELATAAGIAAKTVAMPLDALEQALTLARERWVLVTGSLYLAGAIRPWLRARC